VNPTPPPPRYTVELCYQIFVISHDGLLKTPREDCRHRDCDFRLSEDYPSIEAAMSAIQTEDAEDGFGGHGDNHFVVLPIVKKKRVL
jgi:hypothetical protein